jgi:hypothetical protein
MEYELIIDTYEQPIERPTDYEEQKEFYSGKKKKHTKKSQIIVFPSGKDIVDVETGEPGKKSDISYFRETREKFAPEQKFTGDKAYVGEAKIKTPTKKPKKGELNKSEKKRNKQLASERIFVEHLIRLVKIFRVVQERFRLKKNKYEEIIKTICGIVRLRIGSFVLE